MWNVVHQDFSRNSEMDFFCVPFGMVLFFHQDRNLEQDRSISFFSPFRDISQHLLEGTGDTWSSLNVPTTFVRDCSNTQISRYKTKTRQWDPGKGGRGALQDEGAR